MTSDRGKNKAKPKTSWSGWGVVIGKHSLRCVFGKDERLLAENEADRYLGAEVVPVKVTRVAKKKRKQFAVVPVRRRRAGGEES